MTQHLRTNDRGTTHPLGCLPRVTAPEDWPRVGEAGAPDLIARSEWDKHASTALESRIWTVLAQGAQNSCAGCAAVAAIMLTRAVSGLLNIDLSQAVPYAISNGGRDEGASIDAVLRAIQEFGTVPTEVIDGYGWQGYYSRRNGWPDGWKDIAADYRAVEAVDCPTYDHAVSAVLRGFPVVLGVDWEDRRGAGHAITMVGWKGRPRILNSWGEKWGESGCDWIKESTCERGVKKYGAWRLRVVSDPKDDGDMSPPNFGMG